MGDDRYVDGIMSLSEKGEEKFNSNACDFGSVAEDFIIKSFLLKK